MRTHAWIAAVLFIGAPAAVVRASVVYNSQTSNPSVNGVLLITDLDETDSRTEVPGAPTAREFDAQVGDSITLAGTDRFVTHFSVRLAAFQPTNFAASADVELNIYTSVSGLPGTLLWTGSLAGITFPSSFVGVDAVFTPNISVPSALVFSVALSSVSNAGMRPLGIAGHSSTLTGASGTDVVFQNTATQAWRKEFFQTPFQNIQAKVTAVPAPAPLVVLGAAMCTSSRRSRRARAR